MANRAKEAGFAAQSVLDVFIYDHQAAAIPAMIAACVLWSVENGGTHLIKSTLANAIKMIDEMNAIRNEAAQ